jgi:hypothetical protein
METPSSQTSGHARLVLGVGFCVISCLHLRVVGDLSRTRPSSTANSGADIIHCPEGALSGYTKSQIKSWNDVDGTRS